MLAEWHKEHREGTSLRFLLLEIHRAHVHSPLDNIVSIEVILYHFRNMTGTGPRWNDFPGFGA